MKLSSDDLSRLIDGLEGTSHLDTTPEEQEHTDQLLRRLVTALHLFRTYLGWLLRTAFHCWFCAAIDHQF